MARGVSIWGGTGGDYFNPLTQRGPAWPNILDPQSTMGYYIEWTNESIYQ